jgi:hypothetical protein
MKRVMSLFLLAGLLAVFYVVTPPSPTIDQAEASSKFTVKSVSYTNKRFETWDAHNRPRARCYRPGSSTVTIQISDSYTSGASYTVKVARKTWLTSNAFTAAATIRKNGSSFGEMAWYCSRP